MNGVLAPRVTAQHGRSGQAQVTPQTLQPRGLLKRYLVQASQRQEAGLSRLKTVKTGTKLQFPTFPRKPVAGLRSSGLGRIQSCAFEGLPDITYIKSDQIMQLVYVYKPTEASESFPCVTSCFYNIKSPIMGGLESAI